MLDAGKPVADNPNTQAVNRPERRIADGHIDLPRTPKRISMPAAPPLPSGSVSSTYQSRSPLLTLTCESPVRTFGSEFSIREALLPMRCASDDSFACTGPACETMSAH